MTIRSALAATLILTSTVIGDPSNPDRDLSAAYLREASQLCEADSDDLWGVSLCGPTLIVDEATRNVVANVADAGGALYEVGGIWMGVLPSTVPIANTATSWNGSTWTMLKWPLPTDPVARATLLMHESWHRIQPALGLATTERSQIHLTTADGRTSLRLELRALQRAVTSDDNEARLALRDALTFRAWRYGRFAAAAGDEAALEANEGLAEYTGWKLSGAITDRQRLAARIATGERSPTFARNFAYYTGPAYGALLDRFAGNWRNRARSEVALPLGLFESATATTAAFDAAAAKYGGAQLAAEERSVEHEREVADARWRRLLVTGPTVTLPMISTNVVFNPNNVHPLVEGNVYPTLQANGPWGTLDASGGALLKPDWSSLVIPAAGLRSEGTTLQGAGWRISLATGWSLERSGSNWRIVQNAPPRSRASAAHLSKPR